MNNLAIIPARGGSKRIPKKNIKDFLGKPIIAYSIHAAIQSQLFSEVMVSTDDEEIAEVAEKYGASVPFLRSEKNADDFATTADVLLEVIDNYERTNKVFYNCCCIYPTAPFVKFDLLCRSYEEFRDKHFTTFFAAVKFGYPIQRALILKGNKIKLFFEEHESSRSQDLLTTYHDAGQFYWFNVDKFKKEKSLFTKNSGVLVLNENQVQDIDDATDWLLAELKYKMFYGS